MKYAILSFLIIAVSLVHAAENLAGFVDIDPDGAAYIYFPKSSIPTPFIFIQWPSAPDHLRCCIKIDRQALKKIDEASGPGEVMNLRGDRGDVVGYRITSRLPPLPADSSGGYAGMAVAAESVLSSSPHLLQAQTRGKKMNIRTCFGTEGESLIVREGDEYQLLYMHFGYEIDEKPKCSTIDAHILEQP